MVLMAAVTIKYMPFDRSMPRNERLLREKAGQGTETVIIGDVSLPLHRLPPPFAESIRGIQTGLDAHKNGDNVASYMTQMLLGFSANLLDETFLQGVDSILQVTKDPGRAGPQAIANFSGSFIPRIANLAVTSSPDLRPEPGADPLASALKALVLGPASKLGFGETQVGPLGEERVRTDIFGSGIRLATDDPLIQELVSAEVFPQMGLPRGLDLPRSIENDAMQAKGQFQRSVLQKVIDSPGYQRLGDPELRKVVLQRVLRKVNRAANGIIKAHVDRGMDITFQGLLDSFNINRRP